MAYVWISSLEQSDYGPKLHSTVKVQGCLDGELNLAASTAAFNSSLSKVSCLSGAALDFDITSKGPSCSELLIVMQHTDGETKVLWRL